MRDSELWEMQQMGLAGRRFSIPPSSGSDVANPHLGPNVHQGHPPLGPSHHLKMPATSEDLHAWSIYRQNLNSDFTDSALGSADKSPLPYGNFQLRESTMQSILNNPKYGPKSELGANMYTYLKFGLPRVLPPGKQDQPAGRDNSSGYDSTDEEVSPRGGASRRAAHAQRLRNARSEDFLNRSTGDPRDGRLSGAGYSPRENWQRNQSRPSRIKSASEANLLSSDSYYEHQDVVDFRKDIKQKQNNGRIAQDDSGFVNLGLQDDHAGRRARIGSKGSQLSVASRHSKASRATHLAGGGVSYRHDAPMLNDKYFPKDGYGNSGPIAHGEYEGFKYPHLQLRNVSYERRVGGQTERLLDNISIEARGGEIVAVLATKSDEGSALCNILADRHGGFGTKLRGDIYINGISVSPSRMSDRVALVQQDNNFSADMSVRQTLLFHSFMREPGTLTRGRDTKGRINALIEDLGLSQVKHTRVADLTFSEKQRLNVACHLLLDTDLVMLDQPTRGMDIFDTFFLVEYLRQWAARGRIVVLTMHPPTYEIFTMISKVVLISSGRLMYYGKRREMLPYFAFIEYPCPAYKNPSDYYLDLVTLDDLSPEALLESSQRVEQLASTYRRRAEPLSDPGPPGILPPKIKRANFLVQIFGLWIRALIYMYPFNVINWVKMVLLSGIMSVAIGAVFVGIRWKFWDHNWQRENNRIFDSENVNDRLGFHYTMMIVGVWPTLLHMITDITKSKASVTRDVEDKLYTKLAYILTKTLYSLPAAGGIFLAYTIPAYLLAGIHPPVSDLDNPEVPDLNSFYLYLGYMLLYLLSVRMLATSLAHGLPSRHQAGAAAGFIITLLALTAGYVIHYDDLPIWLSWFKFASPVHWMNQPIMLSDFGKITFHCRRNPTIIDTAGIIKLVPCGLQTGKDAISYFQMENKYSWLGSISSYLPVLATAAFIILFLVLSFVLFVGRRQVPKLSRARKTKM